LLVDVQSLLVGGSPAIGATLLGYYVGLEKLRRERGFELRLKWHQSMLELVHQFAYDLETAASLLENDGAEDEQLKAWQAVKVRQREFVILSASSLLYAAREDMKIVRLEVDIDGVATDTSAWSSVGQAHMQAVRDLAARLRNSAKPFARKARHELRVF
jgi:hypothetical protein